MARKGEHLSEKTKRKLSLAKKGRMLGSQNPFYGKKHSATSKKKMSETHKQLYSEGKWKAWNKGLTKDTDLRVARISKKRKGQRWSEESRKKMSKRMREQWKNPQYRKNLIQKLRAVASKVAKERWKNPQYRAKILKHLKPYQKKFIETSRRLRTDKHKQGIGKTHRKLWADPEYRKTHVQHAVENAKLQWQNPKFRKMHEDKMASGCLKKMLIALNKRPTNLEKQFMAICDKHSLPFEYVGDGDFFVGSKNPDFIHSKGDKVCVEVANTYPVHHSKDYPDIRKKYFAEHGWDCVVFMGNKLDEVNVLSELRGVS